MSAVYYTHRLSWIVCSASSLKQQSVCRHVAPLEHKYPDSEATNHCTYSLILHVCAQDLPHSRRAH